ncbi:ATP-binding cassette domain-containing protein [Legionella geestiana]|uniref:ATP-binding cassette domain-containing protein n=1 Tax=Legionella geestiana TaxID=45065 RepID=UPI0010931CAF|nr:ATP-binding cassette domain-containing protein [Legionella geestiana]QDQ40351.1 ATP-binding cassette domain-containing protein [Legionella geestiana]
MSILALLNVSFQIGGHYLLKHADLQVEQGERIALTGRNGAGKTTLMRIIAGTVAVDSGQIHRQSGISVAGLDQEVPVSDGESVYHFLVKSLGETGEVLAEYRRLLQGEDMEALSRCQQRLDNLNAWEVLPRVETMASRLGIDPDAEMQTLSGGMKRRTLLAAALIANPGLLLLDEPTNHLDVESIEWLESYLASCSSAVVFVSHDRAFLERVATRIVEVDRGHLHSYACDYQTWLDRREERLLTEQKHNALFDKRLQDEETWIRTGIKARRTRNEGRVRALKAMREQYRERRLEMGRVQASTPHGSRSGEIVLEAKHLTGGIGGRTLVRDLSLLVLRGEKIGILGPNGCGKTTLVRLLLGELTPESGTLRHGTGLEVAFFDQMRSQLDLNATVLDNVADGAEHVVLGGKQKHVASYLKDFLFQPACFNQPAGSLSGGERNRLMLARVLAKPVNLLVMDEPTNDLDMETLELLEQLLVEYKGTLLLISHDRTFINRVVTSVLVYEGDGHFAAHLGGFDEWKAHAEKRVQATAAKAAKPKAAQGSRLSYNEQRELKGLPAAIEALEARIGALNAEMAAPGFYQQDTAAVSACHQALSSAQAELEGLFERWETLEARQG